MANVITFDNFKPENIILSLEKKYVYSKESKELQFKKVYPKYIYDNGVEDDIYIQIPEVASYGVTTFDNSTAGQAPTHTFSFVIDVKPSLEDDIDEYKAAEMNRGIIYIFEEIQTRIKDFLSLEVNARKLAKNVKTWPGIVDNIKPVLSYQVDKETQQRIEGVPPTLFAKLKTENNRSTGLVTIKTNFSQITTNQGLITVEAPKAVQVFQKAKCQAMGVIHFESVYIPKTNLLSFQYKIADILVTSMVTRNASRLVIPKRLLSRKPVERVFESDEVSESTYNRSRSPSSNSSVSQQDLN